MSIDDRCNPKKNARLAQILTAVGFDYTDVKPAEFTNPATSKVSAVILRRSKEDIVLVLLPNLGTSVLPHRREVGESVHYLGPVDGTGEPLLLYKFQDNHSQERVEGNDVVKRYSRGALFDTIGNGINGIFHGYHNSDLENPIALRIIKRFA